MLQGLLDIDAIRPSATDPFFSSVVLLMGFEGANGSTGAPGMTDQSPAAHGNAVVNGAAQISTVQQKFGSSSLRVTGSGTQDQIHFADSANWNLAAGNFTIECFVNPVAFIGGGSFLVSQFGIATTHGWAFWLSNDLFTFSVSTTGSDNITQLQGASGLLTTGTWFHTCVDFDGSKYRMYIGGTMVASSTTLRTIFDSPNVLSIGGDFEQLLFFYNGYMDELRITKGVARYATDTSFTPPTAAFPRS